MTINSQSIRIMIRLITLSVSMLFLCNFICVSNANTATINASSCSYSDVQAAINSASNGDTVIVPSGTCTWTVDFELSKGITLLGQGIDQTIIVGTGGGHTIDIRGTEGNPFRVAGFTLKGNNEESYGINVSGTCKDFRIDHCKFEGFDSKAIKTYGYTYGVIDHCIFTDASSIYIGIFGSGTGDDAWGRPLTLGTANAVYVEDCTFLMLSVGKHGISSNIGARYVFRHNKITIEGSLNPTPIDAHGNCFAGRGTFSYEIYENEINSDHKYFHGMFIRGGTGVIYNNTFTGSGSVTHHIHLTNYQSRSGCGIDYCKKKDCCPEDGYPCDDQINNLYIWNNYENGSPVTPSLMDDHFVTTHVQKDRDYFEFAKPGYAPYTYPHPLISTGGSQPSVPSNFRIQ